MKKSELKNTAAVLLTLKAIKVETLIKPSVCGKKWYNAGDKVEIVVASESRECSTAYDWGNFNAEFRQRLEKQGAAYDYIVCDDDYEFFDKLREK